MENEEPEGYVLERYKFVLAQIDALNQNAFKYLALFQALATAIIGAAVAVFVSQQSLKISTDVAVVGIRGLLYLFTIVALFVVVSLLTGILSWLDYRNEEVELLTSVGLAALRERPASKNFWRWYETYFIVFIVLVAAGVWIFVEGSLLPLLQPLPGASS